MLKKIDPLLSPELLAALRAMGHGDTIAIVDAHQHFWSTDRNGYNWLTAALRALWRDFLPGDLEPLLMSHGIAATVAPARRRDHCQMHRNVAAFV